jgi:hypothetical protein
MSIVFPRLTRLSTLRCVRSFPMRIGLRDDPGRVDQRCHMLPTPIPARALQSTGVTAHSAHGLHKIHVGLAT